MLTPEATHAQLMPSTAPYAPSNFEQHRQNPADPFAGPHSHFQAAPTQLQNQYVSTHQYSTMYGLGDAQATMPFAEQPAWNAQRQQFLPAGQMPLPQFNYGQISHAQPSTQVSNQNVQSAEADGALPHSSPRNCCSKSPVDPSSEDSPLVIANGPDRESLNQTPSTGGTKQSAVIEDADNTSSKDVEAEVSRGGFDMLMQNVPYTDIWSLPPNYATAQNPLTPEQCARLHQNANSYRQHVPSYAADGITGSAAPSAERIDSENALLSRPQGSQGDMSSPVTVGGEDAGSRITPCTPAEGLELAHGLPGYYQNDETSTGEVPAQYADFHADNYLTTVKISNMRKIPLARIGWDRKIGNEVYKGK
ncbi:MAG: hypothetical protein Q9166_001875 [cf. Caloplaca sp. 2 TL-2023]